MQLVPRQDVDDFGDEDGDDYRMRWVEGPHQGDRLDVGLVHCEPGSVSPPHVHAGGQVMVVVSGRGFVETADGRVVMESGDMVIAAPGEEHVHGASDDSELTHLTISAGPFVVDGRSVSVSPDR